MKIVKIISIIFLVIVALLGLATLAIGGFAPLFGIGFGLLFIYYFIIYRLAVFFSKKATRLHLVIGYVLLFFPVAWALIDIEGFFDFLLQGVKLDMR